MLEVSVTVTNRDVAPFCADWPVQVVAVGPDAGESSAKLLFATNEVEASLGQPNYHFRPRWFSRLIGEDKVSIHGDSQTIVELLPTLGIHGKPDDSRTNAFGKFLRLK